jgi:hypothetical protein
MGEENPIENLGEEGYRSLGKMHLAPVRYTFVRGAFLTSDFRTSLGLGKVGSLTDFRKHVNHFNCRDRRIEYRLKLKLQLFGKDFGILSLRK